jgi:hypothetical protein
MGHKTDRPCLISVVQHLQEVWIGMGKVLTKGNWPEVSVKLKNLSNSIQKYVERISSQAEMQLQLINQEEPARTVETASNVSVVESLPLISFLPSALYSLNERLLNLDVYERVDVNTFMTSLIGWQRCDAYLEGIL